MWVNTRGVLCQDVWLLRRSGDHDCERNTIKHLFEVCSVSLSPPVTCTARGFHSCDSRRRCHRPRIGKLGPPDGTFPFIFIYSKTISHIHLVKSPIENVWKVRRHELKGNWAKHMSHSGFLPVNQLQASYGCQRRC